MVPHGYKRRQGRHHFPPLFTTFLVVVSISSIWQSSEVNNVLFSSTSTGDDDAVTAPTVLLLGDDPLSADYAPYVPINVNMNVNVNVDVVQSAVSEFRSFPRLLDWSNYHETADHADTTEGGGRRRPRRTIQYTMTTLENFEKDINGTDDSSLYREFEKEWYTQCRPVEEIPIRPTCNSLHELGAFETSLSSSSSSPTTTTVLLSMEGNWRSVWKTPDPITHEQIILKLLQLHRDFDLDAVRGHEMDIRIMERLSASPHIVSSYGFCGQSVLTQLAQSSGAAVIKNPQLSWRDRLSIARDLAQGLAELHALQPIDWEQVLQKAMAKTTTKDPKKLIPFVRSLRFYNKKPPVFAHYDINIANTISLNPKGVQWNDFNLGMMSQYHTDGSSGACSVPVRYPGIMWRSPEEIQNTTGQVPTLHPSDVYAFGTLLYTVFTKHQPWTHLEERAVNPSEEEIAAKKIRGDLPNLPPKYQPQERLEAKVLWTATKACFQRDPNDRPTAYRLAVSLGLALERIQSRKPLSDDMIEKLFS